MKRLLAGILVAIVSLQPVAWADPVDDVRQDLPTIAPEHPTWTLRGIDWSALDHGPRGEAGADAREQAWLRESAANLFEGEAARHAAIVLRLSPPGAAPRAVAVVPGRHTGSRLYLMEKRPTGWRFEPLINIDIDATETLDLSGDGRPELVAAVSHGSGSVLTLYIFTWDDQAVRLAFQHWGAMEPGNYGFGSPGPDGRRDLWIDTGVSKGFFTAETYAHRPFLRDRLRFHWEDGTYRQVGRYRFATPFYHLNRYLFFAAHTDWLNADRHIEPGARIDRELARTLGFGPFSGGEDGGCVNCRMRFQKGTAHYFADFGPTGKLLRLGADH